MPKIKGARPTIEIVGEALSAHSNATVDELSTAVGVGRSSVAKVLVELEGAGRAVRAAGGRDGGRRLPDLWSPVIGEVPNADADVASTTSNSVEATTPTESRERLGKGALGDLVRAHLVANPDVDHGPVAVAKALGGKSSGAVGNFGGLRRRQRDIARVEARRREPRLNGSDDGVGDEGAGPGDFGR